MNVLKIGSLAVGVGAVGLLAFWFAGRDVRNAGDDAAERGETAAATRDGAATPLRPLAGRPAVAEAQLAGFAAEIERLIGGAAERVIAQGSGSADAATAGPLRVVRGRRVPDGEPLEREFDVAAAGQTGSVRAMGLAFTRPWPARYDMTMQLAGFSHAATLTADGAVQYNFIRDDRAAQPLDYGLFRARLTLSGSFTGEVDLHGEFDGGKIVSLVVLTGGSPQSFTFGGRAPKTVVTYVTTVAGTGEEGNRDGPALEAQLAEPSGVLVDRDGRVFIADTANHAIRELSPSGELTTLSTAFEDPWDLGFDGLGLLVVSDRAPSTDAGLGPISRVVTGGTLKGMVIRTIGRAGQTSGGFPLCSNFSCDGRSPLAQMQWSSGIDVEGAVVTAAQWALPVGLRLVTPDGTVMTTRTWSQGGTNCSVEAPGGPYDVVRVKGVLYLTTDCHTVYRMQPDGTLEPFAGAPTKDLGFADGVGAEVKFSYPAGLVSDGEYLYLTESTGQRLRRIDLATGETLRIAGCLSNVAGFDCNSSTGFVDGPGDAALFYNPQNLALDPWGDLYVADNDNHAIRFVRLANDPERRPTITSVQPLALQRGAEATVTVRGRDLGLVRSADFGAGVTAEVFERSAKNIKVRVRVAADAPAGAHAFSVTTPFGAAAAPVGVALNVIEERASRAQVRTIAGTGDWSLGVNDIVPAEQAQFAFPGGIAAIDRERLLVADPLEQRIRLITTKDGAARELVEIAAYQAGGQTGLAILQGIEGLENLAGDVLGIFGVGNPAEAPREALMEAVSRGLDEICRAAGSDCEYMALPWAGISGGAGDSEGFRLGARLFLPTDIAVAGDGKFVIADTGNQQIKTVGIDFSGPEPMDAPYIVSAADDLRAYPLAAIATAADTVIAATSAKATLAKVTLRDESSVLSGFAGVEDAFRCSRADGDVRHPLGVPMGMAAGESGAFIADPYCATIWRLDENGEVEDIRGELKLPLTPLPKCSDGPLVFATFSAPMDVAVDSSGNIWVADSGCHSIRVIKPLGADDVRAALDRWAGGITGWFDSEAAQQIASLAGSQNLGSYDAARMWVTTVAGAADGEAGFRDGAASEALFNAPVSIAIAEEDGNTYVFVSDVGNKRIRLIDMNARVETTTRVPPPGGALGPGGQPGAGDEPLSPIDAVNYLLALPWQGLAAQTAADGAQAVDDALEDVYIARGTGEENGLAWSFSLRVNDADADIDLSSPPGFVAASEQGFEVGAPLTGAWRAGFSADVDGNATVKAGNLELFSWTPTIFGFGLGVRDLRMTAKVDLDPNVPGPPALESAATNVRARLYGTGAIAFDLPLDLNPGLRQGAFVLTGELVDEDVDLGPDLDAKLTADVELALLPIQATLDAEVETPDWLREQVRTLVEVPDEELVDLSVAMQAARVTVKGRLRVELPQVGGVSAPFDVSFDTYVPSFDELNQALGALKPSLPRDWGTGPPPPKLELALGQTPPAATFAAEAAAVDGALRASHAPDGVVLSLVHPTVPETGIYSWGGDEDAALFTGAYLAAQSYRYAAAPSADALAGVRLALGGIEGLFDATTGIAVEGDLRVPVRSTGILSRVLIHYGNEPPAIDFNPKLSERECYYEKAEGGWRVTAGRYSRVHSTYAEAAAVIPALVGASAATRKQIEPVGNVTYAWGCSDNHPVSRDQYIGVMMGLALANRLVADSDVQARTARLIEQALDYLIASGWNVPLPPHDRIAFVSSFLGNYDKQLAMLRLGKTVNPRKYGALYDYVAQASSLTWIQHWFSTVDPISAQYFKFNLAQSGLAAVMLLEDDAALRANYRASADVIWRAVGHHRNAYFDLLHVLFQEPAERAAALDAQSAFGQPGVSLRSEIMAVLGEWLERRDRVASSLHPELPMNRVPDVPFLLGLWPNEVAEYIAQDGTERVYTVKALPVSARLGRNMEFVWEKQPFEPGFVHDIDRTDLPTDREVREKGERGAHRRTEGPGVDYLVAYWLAAYLEVLTP